MQKPIHFGSLAALVIACVVGWRFPAAWLLPPTLDEAYYWAWAQYPDLGYLDHPAGVSWAALTGHLSYPEWNFIAVRLGTLVLGLVGMALAIRIYGKAALKGRALLAALVLFACNFATLGAHVIVTPDSVSFFFWVLALHELQAALIGHRGRWLTTGLAVGLGLFSKYTIILFFPVALWAAWVKDRSVLRSPWPWAGLCLAFLVFAPHLWWNTRNDNATLRFQLAHRFGGDVTFANGSVLPTPLPDFDYSPEAMLAKAFVDARSEAEEGVVKKPPPGPVQKAWNQVRDFVGGQLGLLGFFLIPILAFLHRRRNWKKGPDDFLFVPATVVPLVFFAILSPIARIEANWPAMWVVGAAGLFGRLLNAKAGWVMVSALANLLPTALLVVHANRPFLPIPSHKDRLLKETSGYRFLSQRLRAETTPVLADTYQITAMVRLFSAHPIAQWPGITRPSELTRRREANPWSAPDLARGFSLVTTNLPPPRLPAFRAYAMEEVRDCGDRTYTSATPRLDLCKRPVHLWHIVKYQRIDQGK